MQLYLTCLLLGVELKNQSIGIRQNIAVPENKKLMKNISVYNNYEYVNTTFQVNSRQL